MGKKRRRLKMLKSVVCISMCALMFFGTAGPSAGTITKGDTEPDADIEDVLQQDTGDDTDGEKISLLTASEGVDVAAKINMPYVAYEGHTVLLSDASEYIVDGERKGIKELYDEGSVRVSFTVTDDEKSEFVSIRKDKCEKYQRKAVFSKPGGYEIEMKVYTFDGDEHSVKQRISIDKAPETISVTGGAKKQNRLQRIEFKTAQNPKYPLSKLELEISADNASEKISVDMLNDGEDKVFRSEHIIARSPKCAADEENCFVSGSIEFMSIFESDTDLSYKITSTDTRGNRHVFDDHFTVLTDKAPVAAIDMSDTYTREEKCRYAVITAEDISQTDGDSLEREWFIKYEGEDDYRPVSNEPGYTDLTDGSAARISFRKTGTGVFYMKLAVRDVWTEGTMDEYTASAVRLGDEAEKKCEVVNIAPHVSIGAHKTKKADIIVLSDKYEEEKALKESFFEKFMSEGVESHVTAETVDMSRTSQEGSEMTETFSHRGDYGYNGSSTAFECELYAVDNRNMYCMDAVWSDPDKGYPEEPFTLTAFDAENGNNIWSYLITSDLFYIDKSRAFMHQDDSEKYLYIVSSGKTLVMSKRTGVPVTVINYELGQYNYVYDGVIYTYCSNGIYAITLDTGSISKVWKGTVSGVSRRVNGLVDSYYRTPQGSIMKVLLDISNGTVIEKYIGKLDSKLFREEGKKVISELTLNTIGIDVDGTAVLAVNVPVYYDNINSSLTNYKAVVQIYSCEGTLLKQEVRTNGYRMKVFAVNNSQGKYNYAGISYDGHDDVTVEVFGVESDYSSKIMISNKNGDPAVFDQIIYSVEENEKIDVTLGGLCVWIYNQTWGNGPTHGYPERCTNLSFDIKSGSASKSSLKAGCNNFSEYARSSDLYTVIHTGRNSQYIGMAALDNDVVKHPITPVEMLYRVFKKNVRYGADQDHKIIIIKNDKIFSSLADDEKNDLLKRITECGYNIYFIGGNVPAGSIGKGNIKYLNENDDYVAQIVDLETDDGQIKARGYSSVSVAGQSGYIERDAELDDDKEYFYEYTLRSDNEYKERTSILHGTLPVLSESVYDSGSFDVYDYEIEDFDDDDINSFFTFENYQSSGGIYTDCYASHTGSGNVGVDHSSIISFEIPEGREGVISFDYMIVNNKSAGKINSNYAEIDGERWEETPGKTGNGNYTHPRILQSGRHQIKLYTGGYGGKMITYTYIDDLKLSYIRRGNGSTNVILNEEQAKGSDSAYKISGSFKTPGKVTSFRKMKDAAYICGEPGEVEYTEDIKGSDTEDLYIRIPDDKKAVGSSVKLNSHTISNYTVNYTMDEFASAGHHGTIKSFNYALSYIPAEWKYSIPVFSGERHFKAGFNSYRGTKGNFSELEMYIVDDSNILIDKHNYLKVSEDSDKTLFLGEKMYSGKTSVRLNFDKGESAIYDFSIYTIQDGRKMYVISDDFSDTSTLKKWRTYDAEIGRHVEEGSDANDINVFSKGEFVKYDISYWDYEDDPSKQSFWKYTHTPANDGEFEKADVILDENGNIKAERGIILNEPVTRFYKDGKYTVEHWQTDDTTGGTAEGGDPYYDRESNHVFLTFYIGGIADAPWIRYIKTVPSDIYEYDPVSLEISFDDALKQELILETSIYSNDNIIYSKKTVEIIPVNGKYEPLKLNNVIPAAACGRYKVICVITSPFGVGTDNMSFTVMSRGNIEGTVYHTDKWDENRKMTDRSKDTFWPGERLMLKADVEGSPARVTAWIDGEDEEIYELSNTEEDVYRGSIWKEDMMFRWGSEPVDKKIIFRAEYKGGTIKMSEYNITFDNSRLYWNIHRTQGA